MSFLQWIISLSFIHWRNSSDWFIHYPLSIWILPFFFSYGQFWPKDNGEKNICPRGERTKTFLQWKKDKEKGQKKIYSNIRVFEYMQICKYSNICIWFSDLHHLSLLTVFSILSKIWIFKYLNIWTYANIQIFKYSNM